MTDSGFEIRENTLSVGEPRAARYVVRFDTPVAEALDFDGIVVVRTVPNVSSNENVYGVSSDGRVVWQVKARKYAYEQSPFTAIRRDGHNVRLFNWDGLELVVDPRTGSELLETYGK